ncbi:hypothetical protein MMYC01_204023 [Madurella mycetomatis]|uniref:Uncharacterized protein n=1 Tax=Madurella mycetomatis TaxID=100816 RepID=A0A175W5D1_9PEZI|nr:hypothetical protein MMYC01_204023 [Madurella mycetomatis]
MLLTPPSSPPLPTPAPTLASAYFNAIHLQPRQTNYYEDFNYSYDTECICTSIIESCTPGFNVATDYEEAATSCLCNYGISYLDCYFDKVVAGSCASYYDWGEYQRSFYSEFCGSIPPSVMGQIQPPTSVSLDFETVDVVTATGDLSRPDYDGQPSYRGTGALLDGECAQTGFTRVDAGNTIYFAGFMGCINDRPECCPWPVATATSGSTGPATDAAGVNVQDNIAYDFPMPVSDDLAQLVSCAEDYYSISGGCCPNGFWPFTSAVGGQTPCWSSVNNVAVPTLTVASDEPEGEKPTSAVVNIVWSMRYPVADPGSGGLSTAAKAGIGAGAGVAAILIIGLAICLWRYRRKNKKLAQAQQQVPPSQIPPQQQQQQHHFQQPLPMMQQAAMPNGQYPPAVYPPNMGQTPPTALAPQNTGTSGGGVSELSSQSGQGLLHNGQPGGYIAGAAVANPRSLPNANMVEMSANREVDPPQEVMGSQIPPGFKGW